MISNQEIKMVLTEILGEQQKVILTNAEMIVIPKKNVELTQKLKPVYLTRETAIKHHHYVRASVIVSAFLIMLLLILSWKLVDANNETSKYKASDIKLRCMERIATRDLKRILAITDSLYNASPEKCCYAFKAPKRI